MESISSFSVKFSYCFMNYMYVVLLFVKKMSHFLQLPLLGFARHRVIPFFVYILVIKFEQTYCWESPLITRNPKHVITAKTYVIFSKKMKFTENM